MELRRCDFNEQIVRCQESVNKCRISVAELETLGMDGQSSFQEKPVRGDL